MIGSAPVVDEGLAQVLNNNHNGEKSPKFAGVIQTLQHKLLTCIIGGLMALVLINTSVNFATPGPLCFSESVYFNRQETLAEMVVEKLLGYENAIAEQQDQDTEDQKPPTNFSINPFGPPATLLKMLYPPVLLKEPYLIHPNPHLAGGFIDIESPPPKS